MPGIHVASLSAGQDIKAALRAFLADRKWPGALILSAVGFSGGTVMRALNVHIQELDRSPVHND